MRIFGWLIFASWLTLVAYWCLSAGAVVRSTGNRWIWWREIALRLGFFALVMLVLQLSVAGDALPHPGLYAFNTSIPMGLIGFGFSMLGVGLAIQARACLGSSWGLSMSSKEKRELVTTGPYTFVRHPIYGGLLLAMLG